MGRGGKFVSCTFTINPAHKAATTNSALWDTSHWGRAQIVSGHKPGIKLLTQPYSGRVPYVGVAVHSTRVNRKHVLSPTEAPCPPITYAKRLDRT